MKSFLQETAEDIIKRFGKELKGIELIFPNKRTDFHFKRSLGQALGKTSWSPKTYTIQRLAGKLTGIRALDKISLLFELYFAFKEVDPQFKYEFEAFYKLGEIILHDFNEIDNYLVDANQIFTNIKDLHEIDYKYGGLSEEQLAIIRQYWQNFCIEKKSKEKEQFLQLWNILPRVYKQFGVRLLDKRQGYEGLIYKELAELIKNKKLVENQSVKIFIGFNALNKVQKELFKYLKYKQKALFYWDNDSYYHHNPIQEAGDFLRKNYEVLGENQETVPGNFKSVQKSINLIGIPGKIGQAKAVAQILSEFCSADGVLQNPEKTVVVLPDENMLFPVLNSIPDFVRKLNITMGYPLKNTALYSLLNSFIRIQQVLNEKSSRQGRIYHKDALAILNHPYIKSRYPDEVEKISAEITLKQMVYVSSKVLLAGKNKIFEELFTPVQSEKAEDSCIKLLNVLFLLFTSQKGRKKGIKTIEDEYIYQCYLEIKRLHEVLLQHVDKVGLSFQVALQFIKQILSNVSIPFEGESTDGLQIMGLIETRNIDFDNVVLLNANEGILPKLNRPPSLISESMRFAFDLPVLKYQDSIFAYFFYRLLQRAKDIFILYDNLGSNSRSGELSRFVYQLELESGFEVKRLQFVQNVKLIRNQQISIYKSKPVLDKLYQYRNENGTSDKKLTASALEKYMNCPFQFYLRYIAHIKEPEKVEEEFSPVDMGIIIHATMEYLYKAVLEKKGCNSIEKNDFEGIFENIDVQIKKAFSNYLNLESQNEFEYTGNLLIVKEVIKKYITNILRFDEQRAPFEILQLEGSESYHSEIEIEQDGKKVKIGISGIIDRIDKIGDQLYIIDYKTGKAPKECSSIDELFIPESEKRKKAIAQVMLYGLLVKDKPELSGYKINPYIYDIKGMYKKTFDPTLKFKIEKEYEVLRDKLFNALLIEYKSRLTGIIEEIFNPGITFGQTEIEKNCNYCDYKAICGREGI